MIPVGMGKQEMIYIAVVLNLLIAQPTNAGTGIHNDQIIACRPDFNACGVTTVF